MTLAEGWLIIFLVIYVVSTLLYLVQDDILFNLSFLNPIKIYRNWSSLNWFGVLVFSICLNILWLPYAIIYWTIKLIYFLLTVGRN